MGEVLRSPEHTECSLFFICRSGFSRELFNITNRFAAKAAPTSQLSTIKTQINLCVLRAT